MLLSSRANRYTESSYLTLFLIFFLFWKTFSCVNSICVSWKCPDFLKSYIFISLIFCLCCVSLQFSSLSSFTDMNAALRLLSPENRKALPRESFRAFSRVMCGHPEVGGERIPSLNWYEDNDIKSFLGKNGTEDTDLDKNGNTSKKFTCLEDIKKNNYDRS